MANQDQDNMGTIFTQDESREVFVLDSVATKVKNALKIVGRIIREGKGTYGHKTERVEKEGGGTKPRPVSFTFKYPVFLQSVDGLNALIEEVGEDEVVAMCNAYMKLCLINNERARLRGGIKDTKKSLIAEKAANEKAARDIASDANLTMEEKNAALLAIFAASNAVEDGSEPQS